MSSAPSPISATPEKKERFNYLLLSDCYNLDVACRPVMRAFTDVSAGIFQVGSSLKRADYRDVDVRLMMFDDEFDRMFKPHPAMLKLVCISIAEWLSRRTGLPIDFQIQRMSDANAEFPHPDCPRNALGFGCLMPIREDSQSEAI